MLATTGGGATGNFLSTTPLSPHLHPLLQPRFPAVARSFATQRVVWGPASLASLKSNYKWGLLGPPGLLNQNVPLTDPRWPEWTIECGNAAAGDTALILSMVLRLVPSLPTLATPLCDSIRVVKQVSSPSTLYHQARSCLIPLLLQCFPILRILIVWKARENKMKDYPSCRAHRRGGRFGMCSSLLIKYELASSETLPGHYGLCLFGSPFGFIVWMPLPVRGSEVAGYTRDLYSQTIRFWILPSPLTSGVILGIICNHLVPQFLL